MKKILLINNLYKPFAKGGAENVVDVLRKELISQGYEVKLITTKPYFQKPESDPDVYYLNSFYYNLSKLPIFLRLIWHFLDIFNLKNYFYLKKILNKEGPELVITNNLKGVGHLTPVAIKKLGADHFHILHDIQLLHPSGLLLKGEENKIYKPPSSIYQKINKYLFRRVDKVISPSSWLLNLHSQQSFFSSSEQQVIPNPISPALWEKSKSDSIKKNSKDLFTFLYVGQIEEHKGIILLIRSFLGLSGKEHPRAQLRIIGDGESLSKAKKEAGDASVEFLGRLDQEGTFSEIKAANCVIIPSRCYENSPGVIYEAALAGTPILASDLGGITELAELFRGQIFQGDNKQDLTKKMKKIYTSPYQPNNGSEKFQQLLPSEYIKKMDINKNQE